MNLREAWCAETSADPANWTPENAAYGQCAVSALVIQDLLGGDLLRAVNEGRSHYWNGLPDGTEIDVTREQFAIWEPIELEERDRAYVLSHPDTARRYEQMRRRLASDRGDNAELVQRYTAAKDWLTAEAAIIAATRPDDYAGAAASPACAVALTLDALWQWPALAQLLADYFNVLAESVPISSDHPTPDDAPHHPTPDDAPHRQR